ncbi:type I polyketide synthase [Streptomyces sp. ICBB 8177]|uniref:type I polyketide synthase n=1 Tax=Streptomyces sp. ICBB 8177 TaxID=563922 RepID=UPI000D682078|nr:type I polyketide synthase [Streptomyces sp. ICBB 8177]PWI44699.1 beta-ketoacyl synthase [Streptomyces sp. ICBB 8177]
MTVEDNDTHIAIVGMACRLPGASTPEEYWHNLVTGVDSVRPLTPDELREWGQDPARSADPRYVPLHGVVDGVGEFDAGFFHFSERDATLLNPQHQMFLECAWEALERAGYDPLAAPGTVGVYAGAGRNGYAQVVQERPDRFPGVDDLALAISNEPEHLASRVSYKLGLTGPSMAVMTACSTSLVAVHEASRALLGGECDMALAGGVTLRVPRAGYWYREGGTMSPDGRCRTFSADAKGIVAGDGAGVVVLRRLQDALDDGDHVHAVIRGSAVNNDGSRRAGFTAPGVRGQTEVIRVAHAAAEVDPASVSYVEAHGTGTPVGDPIEVSALTQAFGGTSLPRGSVALGSVKTNIGHTDTAAGVAGLIKTALALEHRTIPATLHYGSPNPGIDFAGGPFAVVTERRAWEAHEAAPRRAGVSSFGIGGTNAHVVLEEAPNAGVRGAADEPALLVLSARSPEALDAMTIRLAEHLRERPELPLSDAAYTLQRGRHPFPYRRYAVCSDHAGAAAALTAGAVAVRAAEPGAEPSVVFVFTGDTIGSGDVSGHVEMGRTLYAAHPAFRAVVDEIGPWFTGHCDRTLAELLDPAPRIAAGTSRVLAGPQTARATRLAIEYGFATLLTTWGAAPAAVVGNGVGLLGAACFAGALALPDALDLLVRAATGDAGLPRFAVGGMPSMPVLQAGNGMELTPDQFSGTEFWLRQLSAAHEAPAAPTDSRHLLVGLAPVDGTDAALDSLGRLWQAGVPVDWTRLHEGVARHRIPLPTYPFERETHIVRPVPFDDALGERGVASGEAATASAGPAPGAGADRSPEAVEERLRTLFDKVLGGEGGQGDDLDFFERGGDSLTAVQLLGLVEDAFGVCPPMEAVFDAPTVPEFAAVVMETLTLLDATATASGADDKGTM